MRESIEKLLGTGYTGRRDGRREDARSAYANAVAQCVEMQDKALLVVSLKGLGEIERDLGEVESALAHYWEAVELCRTLDDPLTLAHTVRHVGDILRQLGQYAPALTCYDEALILYRGHSQMGTLDLANTLRGYALSQAELGHKGAAIEGWREAGELYDRVWREPGSPYREADLMPGVLESRRQVERLSAL